VKGRCFEMVSTDHDSKYKFSKPWSPPSKLPTFLANSSSFANVSKLGLQINWMNCENDYAVMTAVHHKHSLVSAKRCDIELLLLILITQ